MSDTSENAEPALVEVQNLQKIFGDVVALQDVSFSLPAGTVMGLLGPNGAGKSTTMKILTGYASASGGTIHWNGAPTETVKGGIKRSIGYLPEGNPLYPFLRVYEYLEFVAGRKGIGQAERVQAIQTVVQSCQLGERIKSPLGELSKGWRQRVGLAAALLGEPELLILDEPLSGLDPTQSMAIRKVIREQTQRGSVLLSTHMLNDIQDVCDTVCIMNEGRVVAHGPVEDILQEEQGACVVIELEGIGTTADVEQALMAVPSISSVTLEHEGVFICRTQEDIRVLQRAVFALCVERQWTLLRMEERVMNLESVFTRLVDSSARSS